LRISVAEGMSGICTDLGTPPSAADAQLRVTAEIVCVGSCLSTTGVQRSVLVGCSYSIKITIRPNHRGP